MDRFICIVCNQDVSGDNWHEAGEAECLRVAIARAESAEAQLVTAAKRIERITLRHRDELAAAQARIAELEAQVAELVARAERNQGSADVLDEIEELMFGWEDDD